MLVLNSAEVFEHRFDRTAVFFLQSIDRDESIFDFVQSLRIVPDGIAERGERARDLLQSVQHILQFIGDPLHFGDVARQRLQQMRGARDLRRSGAFVFIDEIECAARRLGELARIGKQ